eukprot:979038-Pyramimonas_sp.AAC.1
MPGERTHAAEIAQSLRGSAKASSEFSDQRGGFGDFQSQKMCVPFRLESGFVCAGCDSCAEEKPRTAA